MLTRVGITLLFAGLGLLSSGLALGNAHYTTLSLVPLSMFLAAIALEPPGDIKGRLGVSRTTPRAGDEMLIEVEYEVPRGMGAVELAVPLPESFTLIDGTNIRLVTKPAWRPIRGAFSFTVRAGKRGRVEVGPLQVESIHAAGIRAPATATLGDAVRVDVKPQHAPVRRVRGLSGFARQLFPENDAAVSGIRTTDFRDIREYASGDTAKDVNWRATARRAGFHAGTSAPLVNEYEREGKKSVWLFLDAAPYMQVGTTVENSFEHAIRAASGIAQFYLDRGYKLGATIYNSGRELSLYPDVGRKQMLRWQRVVVDLQPGPDADDGLFAAVERAHRWLLQERPLVVIVTRAAKADEGTFLALRKLRSLTGRRRRKIPVLMVSPVVHASVPNDAEYAQDIVQLLRRKERPILQRVRRMGVKVVEWDPTIARFESVLLQSSTARGGATR